MDVLLHRYLRLETIAAECDARIAVKHMPCDVHHSFFVKGIREKMSSAAEAPRFGTINALSEMIGAPSWSRLDR